MATELTRRGFLGTVAGASAAAPFLKPAPVQAAETGDTVKCTVNGEARAVRVHDDETALELVRDRLGLTGAKEGCGHGACGACAIHLDGVPVAACLLPATSLEGRAVRTVDSIADHPVQKAFIAEDALQCGYCTPGFVTEAVAFHDAWRASKGTAQPSRNDVAAALAGHLCRCGAYEGIYRAVIGACAGKFDGPLTTHPRVDAAEKVNGKAQYTVDVKLPGQLEGRVLRSPHAHARLRGIDVKKVREYPGVKAVIQLVAAGAKVRYAGQEVVAVAAVDRRTADAALALVDLNWDVMPAAVGLDGARKPGAAVVYPEGGTGMPGAAEGPYFSAPWNGNVRGPMSTDFFLAKKRAPKVVAAAPVRHEGVYRTGGQIHTTLEPHAAVAHWEGGRVTVYASTQATNWVAEEIAKHWKLKPENVRVIARYVGGGFGSKATLDATTRIAIDLAKQAGAPVRHVLDRAEEMTVAGYRPAQEIRLAIGADEAGELAGMTVSAYSDTGLAAGNTSSFMFQLMYPKAEKQLSDYDVVSHAAPCRAFRAPGGPPSFFAMESGVDEVARSIGKDPIAVRRLWDPHEARNRLYDWAEALPMWKERGGGDQGRFRRGVGVAGATWLYLAEPAAQVRLIASTDGWRVECAVQDIGNGSRTVLARSVALVLGIAPEEVTVVCGDTDLPHGAMCAGSRTTASIGPAAQDAARQVGEALARAWGRMHKTTAKFEAGGVSAGGKQVPWKEVLARVPKTEAIGRRKGDDGGWYLPFQIAGLAVGRALCATFQATEVEVDTRLGRLSVVRTAIGVSAGRIVAPELAESQVRGAVIQGIGYALYEERRMCPVSGRPLTQGLEDYRLMGIGDLPPIDVHFDEAGFDWVEGGAIGMSEAVTCPASPSIANAVRQATGWRPTDLPIRPERVLAGLSS